MGPTPSGSSAEGATARGRQRPGAADKKNCGVQGLIAIFLACWDAICLSLQFVCCSTSVFELPSSAAWCGESGEEFLNRKESTRYLAY